MGKALALKHCRKYVGKWFRDTENFCLSPTKWLLWRHFDNSPKHDNLVLANRFWETPWKCFNKRLPMGKLCTTAANLISWKWDLFIRRECCVLMTTEMCFHVEKTHLSCIRWIFHLSMSCDSPWLKSIFLEGRIKQAQLMMSSSWTLVFNFTSKQRRVVLCKCKWFTN